MGVTPPECPTPGSNGGYGAVSRTPDDCEKQCHTKGGWQPLDDCDEIASKEKMGIIVERPWFGAPPGWRCCHWFGWSLGATFTFGFVVAAIYVFCMFVVGDKSVKGVCTEWEDMTSHLCILSAGQLSMGIFSFGQLSFGLFSIGQVNVALLFSVGQVAITAGYVPIAQLGVGLLVEMGQLVLAVFRVRKAQFGFNALRPFFGGPAVVSCHKDCCT